MDVGVEAGGVLDRQRHAGLLRVLDAGRDHGAEPLGGLLPGEAAAAAGEQVDGTRADRGRGVDHRGQRVPRGLRVAGQPAAGEKMVDRLDGIVVALQQHWEFGIEQLAVQDAQPADTPSAAQCASQFGQRCAP